MTPVSHGKPFAGNSNARFDEGASAPGNPRRNALLHSHASNAAILLCAGKGTRMGSSDRSKVCYDCAGVPVIRRIVRNMREGGVGRFVIVVGHMAESVMSALDGEPGLIYAYQKEQKGTGHATMCGLRALEDIGFSGPVIVSMGDKIVSPRIVRELLEEGVGVTGKRELAVCGVQPREEHPNGGHVMVEDGRALGIVEYADVKRALQDNLPISLCGRTFTAEQVAATPWVNTALYRFDAVALGEALKTCGSDNAQGEIYLTDTIEYFAKRGEVAVYKVLDKQELLTYSTKVELRTMSRLFLRPASVIAKEHPEQAKLFEAFLAKYGDRPAVVASAPGRINLMGRHIEHRGGSVNMMAIAARTTIVAAPREDDQVSIANLDSTFPAASFKISDYLPASGFSAVVDNAASQTSRWLDFLDSAAIRGDLEASRGHWVNYVKSAVLRFQMATDVPLCGMDMMVSGDIPVAAGMSSSSAIVVATAEALVALNELNLTTRDFVDLCGEGEWYVGSRGGAGDHAAMKCSREGCVTHLKFKPFAIGESVAFPKGAAIVVVNSGEMAKKSEGARETFNARVRDYETAFNEVKRHFPELPVAYFRDLAFLPPKDRVKALSVLTGSVKGVATFGVNECRRAEACLELLKRGALKELGEMMKESHDGDRLGRGEYECSTVKIDALVDRLNAMPGVYGSQLVGAGLGGCVIALTEADAVESVVAAMKVDGLEAFVCSPSKGSRVEY